MAIVANNLTSGSNASWNAVTASINPTTTPVIVAVAQAHDYTYPGEPSVSGCGLTWAVKASVTYASRRRLTVLVGTGTPSSGALTITGPSDSGAIGLAWAVVQFSGVASLGAAATASGSGAVATATLSGSPVSGDWAWAAGTIEGNVNPTWEASYAEEYDVIQTGNVRRLTTAHSTSYDGTPRFTWSGSEGWAMVGFYLTAEAAGGGFQPAWASKNNQVIL